MQLFARTPSGDTVAFSAEASETVGGLRSSFGADPSMGVVFAGTYLEDGQTL
eukprot:CAMPEP_0171236858 /NCGR_PEP_ID=MMETSP0790-20130122/42673_1 /TAXON_ID=2925 /ORGANISM="Alexandrium catenella, Strain OF101" /LENGTH=51 /DNA_ID=CAMNT_0011703203 /DNA_START=32 /DNA_END=184 /DNA_ORIENTATION=+